jgi:hypothetical protein
METKLAEKAIQHDFVLKAMAFYTCHANTGEYASQLLKELGAKGDILAEYRLYLNLAERELNR